MKYRYEYIATYGFLAVGVIAMICDFDLPQWYIGLLIFIVLKWVFNYKTCILGNLECWVRKQKQDQGYIHHALGKIVDLRNTEVIAHIMVLSVLIFVYHYIVKKRPFQFLTFLF